MLTAHRDNWLPQIAECLTLDSWSVHEDDLPNVHVSQKSSASCIRCVCSSSIWVLTFSTCTNCQCSCCLLVLCPDLSVLLQDSVLITRSLWDIIIGAPSAPRHTLGGISSNLWYHLTRIQLQQICSTYDLNFNCVHNCAQLDCMQDDDCIITTTYHPIWDPGLLDQHRCCWFPVAHDQQYCCSSGKPHSHRECIYYIWPCT